jgi:hypothetical protein
MQFAASEPLELFDPTPVLANSRLAAYDWGTGELTLSDAASLREKTLAAALIEVAHGQTSLETKEDLLCLIAAIHEFRHFQQDLITGVGHWDYVSRVRQIIHRLSFVKGMSQSHNLASALAPELGEVADRNSMSVFHRPSQQENALIAQNLDEIGITPAIAELFTTRRLLELDAVLYTYYLITSTGMSEEAAASLEELKQYYFYFAMPDIYKETIMFCLREMFSFIDEDIPPEQTVENVTVIIRSLLAFSLAHPPPSHFEATGQRERDYLPGIRFLRLFKAAADLMRESEAPAAPEDFEAVLNGRSGYAYLTYPVVGDAWIDYFKGFEPDPFSAVTDARREALEAKLRQDDGRPQPRAEVYREAIGGESILAFVLYDLPLFTGGSAENALVLTRRALVSQDYDADRRRAILGWRLSEYLIGRKQSFLCPFSDRCGVATDRCKTSYGSVADVPPTTGRAIA